MGVTFIHGQRSEGARGSFKFRNAPEAGVCAYCGATRDVVVTSLGKSWAPLAGTWWHVHSGGATCSPVCRALLGVQAGPYDAIEPCTDPATQ